ncbi:MAG TPA: hypothetical protein VNK95_16170 [Caldilineaceae bacterium]|nr:hypothetical protein [Caldilineaceae bacterium]
MDVWTTLLAGIILGWVVEWVIDWLYWRPRADAYHQAEYELHQELAKARQELDEANATIVALREQLERRPRGQESMNAPAASTAAAGVRSGERRPH